MGSKPFRRLKSTGIDWEFAQGAILKVIAPASQLTSIMNVAKAREAQSASPKSIAPGFSPGMMNDDE
ncbi:hypothetical protein DYBT9623_05139 [Dyadobacter sp. CECT 9623]|uniref:Uncharacterized protein n=1 Tax=Dyadobacter linearis TaxID=2823330 RepID=A0ABM8UXP9_9BACT|nr:hypothetical protein [Dyadobacter sp. CECT 9623]CAG5074452.1 hypothetical protein DYBT9623_05139 [Dyadobacter sp. CECT 9623]